MTESLPFQGDAERSAGDVRMRGFAARSRVNQAWAWVDEHAQPCGAERIPVGEAQDRVLAEDVRASIDVPPFDRAAMDGYAVRSTDTEGAGDYNPLALDLVGESMPARPFGMRVAPGMAVKIMTGAPLPEGTDAVVPAEYASESEGRVLITAAVSSGKHVGWRGEDVQAGAVVLTAGRRLRPQDVALAAATGAAHLDVARRPRVRIVVTGNELVSPGQTLAPGQIYECNSILLRGLVERDGGVVESVRRVRDDRKKIGECLLEPGADVVLVSGGSSVGAEDHVPSLVKEHGELAIHGIAMRPSSPAGMGRIGDALIFLLPGNPVSCLCAYDFFAGRAVRALGGRSRDWPYVAVRRNVERKIVSAVGRVDYCRVALHEGGIIPLALSGASILSSTVRADGFVVVPEEMEGYPPGCEVTVHLYGTGQGGNAALR